MFALALVLVAAVWELYKVIGPQDGGTIFGWTILPRANDTAMPHVWEMFSRYGQPENRASSTPDRGGRPSGGVVHVPARARRVRARARSSGWGWRS